MAEVSDTIPAATLVLMRERRSGPPDLLMMERTGHMAFAAGALVFPGGRIDEEDRAAARPFAHLPDAAARIAAVRETIEETGIVPAVAPALDEGAARHIRAELVAGRSLPSLLAGRGVALDLDALTPFARWCPNFREARRFDTLFYLAEAPADAPEPQVAEAEAVRVFWASAQAVLADLDAGRARAIFPTRRNLERLAGFASLEEARAHARRHPVRTITPWVEPRGDQLHLCIPEDAGYPVTSELLENVRRH